VRELVKDPTRAWDPRVLRARDLEVSLDPAVSRELAASRALLAVAPPELDVSSHALERFPALVAAVESLRRRSLEDGFGAFVLRAGAFAGLSEVERANAFWLFMRALGEPLAQNAAGDRFVAVRDEGQRMSSGGRYHKSNEGGELHTDGPQFDEPPRWIGLRCVRRAAAGGVSKLVSAYSIHNALLEEVPQLLPLLYEPHHFHRKPGPETIFAPIFQWTERDLRVRYLGEYVRSGHRVAGSPLDGARAEALAALDRALAQEARFAVELFLEDGDVLVHDNYRILHGRSAFQDEGGPGRELSRVWVRS
jgi:alpha-ketoglutarate-dependent taurine dioxygenase